METLHHPWQVSSMCSSSVGVMLRFLSFSGSRNSSSTLSVTTSQLWLLWLLSPFLHMITSGDHTPGLNERLCINSMTTIHSPEMDDCRNFDTFPFRNFGFQTFRNFESEFPTDRTVYIHFTETESIVRFDSYKA
jgi:hypothetical protein